MYRYIIEREKKEREREIEREREKLVGWDIYIYPRSSKPRFLNPVFYVYVMHWVCGLSLVWKI